MGACRIVTSWPLDSGIGSGVAQVARAFQRIISHGGIPAELVEADYPSGGYLATGVRRVWFNYRIARRIASTTGPVVSFDFDGFTFPPHVPFVSINQGVAGDIIQFETGAVKQAVRLMAALEGKAARKARRIFVPSRFAAQRVCALYGIASAKAEVMPNGIFFDEWSALVKNAIVDAKRPPTVLCVARLYRRKGVDMLLRAWPGVLEKVPEAVLMIAGGGLEFARLNSMAKELGIGKSVRFEGDVTSRLKLAALYAGCDLFCLPSRHETFGLVFLEAMAAGKPVVALDSTAAPEVVRNGVDGLLVRDETELAEAIVSLLRDGQLREKMGASGKERAMKEFKWEKTAQPLMEYLRGW
ncbi:MAG: glycosyltransferase family 4 protein [Nitrospinae bacterium]|nr:glycosyltransferase family 4 protein [Nitrospinota bacterium]